MQGRGGSCDIDRSLGYETAALCFMRPPQLVASLFTHGALTDFYIVKNMHAARTPSIGQKRLIITNDICALAGYDGAQSRRYTNASGRAVSIVDIGT